jgi:putative phosphoesterase
MTTRQLLTSALNGKKTPERNTTTSQFIEISGETEELLLVSDIHGYRHALDGFEKAIFGKKTRYQILFCGDLYAPGTQPVECTAWVMEHAGRLAVRGNHDDEMLVAQITQPQEPLWSEAGAKQNLTDVQLDYMTQLPHRLEVTWRGKRIVLMHGHIRPDGGLGNYITTPQEQMEWFYDEHADLCAMGHSHFPYVGNIKNTLMANCGSMSTIMLGMLTSEGLHAQSGEETVDAQEDIQSSFVSVTMSNGELLAKIMRFQVDQAAMIEDLLAVRCPYTYRIRRCMQDGISDSTLPLLTNAEKT